MPRSCLCMDVCSKCDEAPSLAHAKLSSPHADQEQGSHETVLKLHDVTIGDRPLHNLALANDRDGAEAIAGKQLGRIGHRRIFVEADYVGHHDVFQLVSRFSLQEFPYVDDAK